MKILVLALLTAVSFNAQADLLRPRGGEFKKVATLKCYLDKNNNGRVSKDEILFAADGGSQTIIDQKTQMRYTVTSAVVTKAPGGLIAKIQVSGSARGVVFAGGGSATLKIETDGLTRARWNSEVTTITRVFGRPANINSNMMDCAL